MDNVAMHCRPMPRAVRYRAGAMSLTSAANLNRGEGAAESAENLFGQHRKTAKAKLGLPTGLANEDTSGA